MAMEEICIHVTQYIKPGCQVDFDGRKEISSLSLKTVVVHSGETARIVSECMRVAL